jgi:peptidoglycan/xylan/chitin deacetylase (PgdA/CDA1 family)
LKSLVRSLLYRSGAAARLTPRDALLVVMFHRVLPDSDPRHASADPEYTVSLSAFEAFLDFLGRDFTPVSPRMLEQALAGVTPLPPRPVLVTFDDGWQDTAQYAAPALAARAIPSLVFVTSGALGQDQTLWRDAAGILSRAGLLAVPAQPGASVEAWLETVAAPEREALLRSALEKAPQLRPLMMDAAALQGLADSAMDVGAHGVSHTPLPEAQPPAEEFQDSKSVLERLTGRTVSGFAFPHGRYNPPLLAQGFAAGFKFLFTSDSVLNHLKDGRLQSPVLERIAISQKDITDAQGRFSPSRSFFFLARRRSAVLDRARGAFAASG